MYSSHQIRIFIYGNLRLTFRQPLLSFFRFTYCLPQQHLTNSHSDEGGSDC